jgi:hypothetical protein
MGIFHDHREADARRVSASHQMESLVGASGQSVQCVPGFARAVKKPSFPGRVNLREAVRLASLVPLGKNWCLERIGVSSFLLKNELTLRHESLGKEEETRTQKPSSGTLRVTNPVRQSLASSRKRVLRGRRRLSLRKRRQPVLRPCDRASKDHCGSPRSCQPRGPRRHAVMARRHRSRRGRRTGPRHTRDPQERGRPSVSTDIVRLGNRHTNSPEPTAVRPAAGSK